MALILDYSTAWLATFAMLAVVLKYTARAARTRWKGNQVLVSIDTAMHQLHIPAGIMIIVAGLVHGLTSSVKLLSINLGTICLVLASLMGGLYVLRKVLKPKRGWMRMHRVLAIVTATVLVCHVVEVGGIQIFSIMGDALARTREVVAADISPTTSGTTGGTTGGTVSGATNGASNGTTPATTAAESTGGLSFSGVTLTDGTYTGTAQGYGPGLTVKVVVKGGLVSSIDVTKHNEVNSRYYTRPIDRIPVAIISAQSLDVDTVSGATMTSVGILNAVRTALLTAVTSGTLPAALSLPQGRLH